MYNLVGLLSSASILLPVISGIYASNNPVWVLYRALFFFFIFGMMIELVCVVIAFNGANNIWLYNVYSLVECLFWLFIFGKWFQGRWFMLTMLLAVTFIVLWVYTSLIIKDIFSFNSIFRNAECILLITLSAWYLLELSRNSTVTVMESPEFWFASALLFYFSSTGAITASATFMVGGASLMRISWYLHSLFNIITNFIFAKAFLCIPRKMI